MKAINNLLKKKWNPLVFRFISLFVFIFIILILYLGSLKLIFNFNSSLIMFILWTLWWPFLYITLLFFGRLWCGFICPVGLLNEMGNSIRKTKKDFLIKYSFLPFVIFFFIVFWEQVSGLFSSTKITLIFLTTFLLSSFIVGISMPRWGFCKHFCPIGSLFGPFSRLSILGVRTNREICKTCETKECIKGGRVEPCPMFNDVPNLNSNKDCLLCANCIKNCPHNSAKLCFVKPGEELRKNSGFNLAESLFIITLLGFSVLLTTKGTRIFRLIEFNGVWIRAFDFIFGIGFFIFAYFFITYISINKKDKNFKENLVNGGYVFLPLVFSLMFFLIVFGFITPLTNINENIIALSKYIILGMGGIWSWKLAKDIFGKKAFVYRISIILIVLFWILALIPGPLNIFPDNTGIYFAEDGETINMSAFSMGFDPAIIKIKSGGKFDINVSNQDMVHSFYIDELNINLNLPRGENRVVRLGVLERGEYEYYCAVPGHKEAGMKGVLIVE